MRRGLPSANAPLNMCSSKPLQLCGMLEDELAPCSNVGCMCLQQEQGACVDLQLSSCDCLSGVHCCHVRQTTATCCYKLELMLGQYNWLLHSCACTLKGNLEEPRGVASVSKHIAPTSTHRNCHCYIATLLIEDVLPFMPSLVSGCSV